MRRFGFNEHGLTNNRHDMAIQVPEMVLVLSSIYEALYLEEPEDVDVPLCVDLSLNWLLNVYDSERKGQIRVLSFKVGVLILCRGTLTEKFLQLFKLVATDKKISQRQLGLLLFDAIQIPKVLGEVASFGGSNIEPSVRSCFSMGLSKDSKPATHVDAKHFLKWVKQEPQALVWLPVLHRLASAEIAKHNAKCKVCHMSPIVGFRYHCTKCFNFDLCHNCFFVGKTAKGHKPDHPMHEYCTSTGASVNLKNLGQAFRNSFRSKKYFQKKQKKLGYLPVNSVLEGEDFTSPTLSPNLSVESRDLNGSNNGSLLPKLINQENRSDKDNHLSHHDEHALIAELCKSLLGGENGGESEIEQEEEERSSSNSAMLCKLNVDQRTELEDMVRDLEDENKQLLVEFENLRRQKAMEEDRVGSMAQADVEEGLKKEAKQLKVYSSRMEARMKILDDHNSKLVEQIQRLKLLLATNGDIQEKDVIRRGENYGTLQLKAVRASELYSDEPTSSNGNYSHVITHDS